MSEKDQNSSYDGWDNDKILVPGARCCATCRRAGASMRRGRIDGFLYRPADVAHWEEAQAQVKAALGRLSNFSPVDPGALRIFDSIESAQMFDSIFNAVRSFWLWCRW
ncbi:MAG: hypothetical protein IPP47_04220 [Bryobacterales bacterium]|nr:hypothetical protein [Bryobacterales bacterium]